MDDKMKQLEKYRKIRKMFNRIIAPLIVITITAIQFYMDWWQGHSISKMQTNTIVNLVFNIINVVIIGLILHFVLRNKEKKLEEEIGVK
ncbi:MAG: hypothetical protein IKE52_03385 [Mogibacterium sp.]|nr:hypothetical protein [Mogibacterium sp.]